ncbi:MAG: outer membrane beta-barrel protein [Bacteroidales bacterium]|nr:outer membrane beta-barrel protein [Bacteroidales bacterium]
MKKVFLLITVCILLEFTNVFSQNLGRVRFKNFINQDWYINVNYGSLLFCGDIKQYDFYPVEQERKWGYGVIFGKSFNQTFSLQGQIISGELSGINRNKNQQFDAEILEYSLNAVIDFTDMFCFLLFNKIDNSPKKVKLYSYVGLGYLDFRSIQKTYQEEKFVAAQGYSADGTVKEEMTTELVVPVGIGLNFRLSRALSFNLEASLRSVYSDKLDVSIVPNSSKDKYEYISLGLKYKFNLAKGYKAQL